VLAGLAFGGEVAVGVTLVLAVTATRRRLSRRAPG
jgi:hypothetical protein